MYNINDFNIRNNAGEILLIDNTIKQQLKEDMYHATDSDGFFVCSYYWADDEGGLVYSHDNTAKAKFITEQILAAILN